MTDAPKSPPTLPDFIFLLSDHESRALACEVAQKLYEADNAVMVFDFLTPIHEGLGAMRNIDWNVDLGVSPPEWNDQIVSLERWYISEYGEEALGAEAYAEALETRETNPAPIVYRDATWTHLKAFLPHLKPHQVLIINLTTVEFPLNEFNSQYYYLPKASTDDVTKVILEASR